MAKTDAAAGPKVEQVACDTHAPLDEVDDSVTVGPSGLLFATAAGRWT